MPSVSIRTCRTMVQACKPFRASTLHGEWRTAADGTELYVVYSKMKRRGDFSWSCTLFVCCDGKWYECADLPYAHRRRRWNQRDSARPLPLHEMVRMDRIELHKFAQFGLAHHPDMTRLLNVSV
jgi:hypothetical protein